jgi:hypothetical protein
MLIPILHILFYVLVLSPIATVLPGLYILTVCDHVLITFSIYNHSVQINGLRMNYIFSNPFHITFIEKCSVHSQDSNLAILFSFLSFFQVHI